MNPIAWIENKMTRKESFKMSLARKIAAPVPFSVKFTVEARKRYSCYIGRTFNEVEDSGTYVVVSHTNNGWWELRPGYFRDYFGVVWNKTVDRTLGVVEEPLIVEPSIDSYDFPSPGNLPVYRFIEENNRKYPEHFHMLSIGFTLFERAWSLTGMEQLMIWMISEPGFIHELLDEITKYNIGVIEKAAGMGGIDCVHFGDDWGSQHGPLIAPEMWREFIKPRFKRTCDAARRHGLYVSLHSCGNVEALIPDMIDCGVDVFDPFQPEAMDIWKLYREYRERIAFWGGLSVQKTFPYGSPDDVRNEGIRLLKEMGGKGGYILAPSHSLSGDVPPENIKAFLDLANNQGNL